MLAVAPRKIVFRPSSLADSNASIRALIAAGEEVQQEVGPPAPGTYRYHFMGDETPRPCGVPRPRPAPRECVPNDTLAVATLRVLHPGQLHDMRRLPVAVWSELSVHVAAGGPTVLQT